MDHRTDAELVEDARHGESAAFDALFWRHYREACDYAARFAAPAIAPDRAAEGLGRVFRSLREGETLDDDLETTLHAAVRSAHADVVRRGRHEVPVDPREAESADLAEDDLPVRRAFARLRPAWRRVLWYTVVLDEPEEDLAQRWGSTPSAVRSLSRRAHAGMAEALAAEGVAADTDLDAVLTPSLLLAVPGLVGHAATEGRGAALVARLTESRGRPVAAALGVVAAAAVAVALVLALTAGPDSADTANAAPEPSASDLGTPILAPPPFVLAEESTIEPSRRTKPSRSVSPSDDASPTESESPSDPAAPTDPTIPGVPTEPTAVPAVATTGASSSGGLVKSANVTLAVVPAGADLVFVRVSNAAVLNVSSSGLRCAFPSNDGGDLVTSCSVVAGAPESFSMTLRASFARRSRPVAGSVTVSGTTGTASDGFSVTAD